MEQLEQLSKLRDLKILEIKQFRSEKRHHTVFDHKLEKVLYFIMREGIVTTIRKIFAYQISKFDYLTFLKVEIQGHNYLNISMQKQTNPEVFVIRNEFIPYFDIDFRRIEKDVDSYMQCFNQFSGNIEYNKIGITHNKKKTVPVSCTDYNKNYKNGLFIYGLGGYVQMYVIHHFKKTRKIACIDFDYDIANLFRKKYGFKEYYTIPKYADAALKRVKIPFVIIASYHSTHTDIAWNVYHANPDAYIFIEKPPCVTLEDLCKLIELFKKGAKLEFGFNRRFIDYSRYVRKKTIGQKLIIICSIKENTINCNHWYLWGNQGTRITGNAIHWFDLANYWIDSNPVELNLLSSSDDLESSLISVLYENGSTVNITISDKGNSLRGVQEKIEIRFSNETIFIYDFVSLLHTKQNGFTIKKTKIIRQKGHNAMYRHFKKIIKGNDISKYTVIDLIRTSVLTFYASEMLRTGERNKIIIDEVNKYVSIAKEK